MYILITWRNILCNPQKVILLLNIVNDDVVRFVWELTERRWFYRYPYMRRNKMIYDGLGDIVCVALFSMYHHHPFPRWDVCLGIYIILRLISLALCYNTELCECYAVRIVLSTIISSTACNIVAWVPCIIAWHNDPLVLLPICECLAWSVGHAVSLVQTYRKLWIVDVDDLFEVKEDCWVYRYYSYRRFLMNYDRMSDILVVGLFILYHLKSIPYWPVCFVICISSRLISFALYSNTKIRKCYTVRTVLPAILSLLCMIALWAPFILHWINQAFVFVPFCIFLTMSGPYMFAFSGVCNKYR